MERNETESTQTNNPLRWMNRYSAMLAVRAVALSHQGYLPDKLSFSEKGAFLLITKAGTMCVRIEQTSFLQSAVKQRESANTDDCFPNHDRGKLF
jgi:hypothetical protein